MASPVIKQTYQPSAQWYWKSNSDPWSINEKEEWTKYSDIESEIIEEVFNAKTARELVELNNYWIDLNDFVQISKYDQNKQRQIKRVLINKNENQELREERFFLSQQLNPPFNDNTYNGGLSFIEEWKAKVGKPTPDQIVEQAANGIIIEGNQLGQYCESRWIAHQLIALKNKNTKEIYKCCIRLYTKECFLYKIINQTLRENDKAKIDTLAPFCFLLYKSWLHNTQPYTTEIYRGANLDPGMIKCHQKAAGQQKCWYGFVSTTKNRQKAENFGNSLFIIDISEGKGIDISTCSDFPNEEEVLLPPGTPFKIIKVRYNKTNHQTNIFLKIPSDDYLYYRYRPAYANLRYDGIDSVNYSLAA